MKNKNKEANEKIKTKRQMNNKNKKVLNNNKKP